MPSVVRNSLVESAPRVACNRVYEPFVPQPHAPSKSSTLRLQNHEKTNGGNGAWIACNRFLDANRLIYGLWQITDRDPGRMCGMFVRTTTGNKYNYVNTSNDTAETITHASITNCNNNNNKSPPCQWSLGYLCSSGFLLFSPGSPGERADPSATSWQPFEPVPLGSGQPSRRPRGGRLGLGWWGKSARKRPARRRSRSWR